jgi:hypothetical protein
VRLGQTPFPQNLGVGAATPYRGSFCGVGALYQVYGRRRDCCPKNDTTVLKAVSARHWREGAGVMDFLARQGPNLGGGDFGEGNRCAVERRKLDHEAFAALEGMDDRAHVARRQSMLRQVRSQCHTIKFSNHASKGYAVIKRGASSPASTNQTVRTRGRRPDGVVIPPSTM